MLEEEIQGRAATGRFSFLGVGDGRKGDHRVSQARPVATRAHWPPKHSASSSGPPPTVKRDVPSSSVEGDQETVCVLLTPEE